MPSKLLGMLASGRPIVATADPETQIGRLLEGCGLLVPAEDSNAIAAALTRLSRDSGLRKGMGEAARIRAVETFEKDLLLEEFEDQLHSLVGVARN